ncbi:RNA polymerase sigma factor [Bacillus salitolerans]|uniref:RNA polymerase sigma factor n=1 Tax=Bacillus salitolerans TaxID=1437434 RepID=A0ABW4LS95_9BACI
MKTEGKNLQLNTLQDFSHFYDSYIGIVYRISLNMLKNTQDAEDVCHDVFLEIYKNPSSYNPDRGSIEAWIAVKTKSRCLDRIKRKKRTELVSGSDHVEPITPADWVEDQVVQNDTKQALLQALEKIPKPQRDAVYGNFFLHQSHQELAHSLQRPLGTVKSLVRYGLKNMKKHLHM